MTEIVCFMFVTILILDPTDAILKLKMPAFALLIGMLIMQFREVNKLLFIPSLIIYSVLIASSVFGFFGGSEVDSGFMTHCFKTFIMSFLIIWADKIDILNKLTFGVVIASLVVITLYIVILIVPTSFLSIYNFISSNVNFPISMSMRNFIGIDVVSVYYKSCMIYYLVFAYYLYKFLNERKSRVFNISIALVTFLAIFFSGTRTTMLAAIGLFFVIILHKMAQRKWTKQMSYLIIAATLVLTLLLAKQLLADEERSMDIKMSLLESFEALIEQKPHILIFGQGPGAIFDSGSDAHGETPQMEWTYLELIRLFGIPLGLLVILIYAYPLIAMWKKRKTLTYFIPIFVGYTTYLIVAATNPYLLGSNGLLAMVLSYSFVFNPKYLKTTNEI